MIKKVFKDVSNWKAFAEFIRNDLGQPALTYSAATGEITAVDVTEQELDAAIARYVADNTSIDTTFDEAAKEIEADREEEQFNNSKGFKATVEFLIEQINELREAQSLPPVEFNFRETVKKAK